MFVVIQDRNNINKYNLDESQIIYKGIRIYSKNGNSYIELKKGLYFDDNSKFKKLEIIKYTVCSENVYYRMQIYVYENDNGINDYKLYINSNIQISSDTNSNIVCNDKYLSKYFLKIIDRRIITNYPVLLNGTIVTNNSLISSGDIIDYLGIRIVYFDNFIYINSFNIIVNLERYIHPSSIIKYNNYITYNTHFIPSDVYELNIDEIKEYKDIEQINDFDVLKSLLPNIIMCIAMSMMAYINFINSNDNDYLKFIIMPISMVVTGVILPLIYMFISHVIYIKKRDKNIDEYVKYLNNYYSKLIDNINRHITSLNNSYFDLHTIKKMLFCASKKSDTFLTISIGKTSKRIPIKTKYTGINDIDSLMYKIERQCLNIEGIPLYIDLKKHNIITIICRDIDNKYYFNKILLELVYKHHYEDIYIGIYSKNIDHFNNIYNLPHLFIYNKRLTLVNEHELKEIDELSLDRPLVLLSCNKYDYEFSNPNIYQVYFSTDNNDVLRNSDCIIEYKNSKGYLYSNETICFTNVYEGYNFDDYFNYLGRLKVINDDVIEYSYKDIFPNDSLYTDYQDKHSLIASFSYNECGLIDLDLHESKHGPHGLIGGSTGSGKSELVISMLLSLCIKYTPEYLNIVLIDYKGGGIKESLSYDNKCLPHIVASISNLENNAIERLIYMLRNECKRRQKLFNSLSELCSVSIMNLDDYLDNNKYGLEKIAHLLIVVDEFAELKKDNPEQIKELISISRIGRSLGLHLILATQKPSGIVDEQIWSNSRFKIALKVFDDKDSNDLIQRNDAAYLYNPGSYIMLVDKTIIKGQTIYTKGDYNGNDPYMVAIMDNMLQTKKKYIEKRDKTITTINHFCRLIVETCERKTFNIKSYHYIPSKSIPRDKNIRGKIVLGLLDDYINDDYRTIEYNINENILIYSSRKYEINSIANTLNENHRQNIIIAKNAYYGKYTSDSFLYDSSDDIHFLFKLLLDEKLENITIIIEDINCLLSYEPDYLDLFIKVIKRCKNKNINYICLSTNSDINYKIISLFSNKVMININDINELNSFYSTKGAYKGKSFCFRDEVVCFVPIETEEFEQEKPVIDNAVRMIPDKVKPAIINGKYLLGFDIYKRNMICAMSDVVIVSYDYNLLMRYKSFYPNISIKEYDHSFRLEENKECLWLGPGVNSQRMFICNINKDLETNQGLYVYLNKQIVIRSIDDE